MSQLNIDNIANQLGTGGPDFVGMPSVGGDPVVESGSNTDGEWTRWADGTQTCWTSSQPMIFADTTRVGLLWSYPVPFLSRPTVPASAGDTNNAAPSISQISYLRVTAVSATSAALALIRMVGQTDFASGNSVPVEAAALGRWK